MWVVVPITKLQQRRSGEHSGKEMIPPLKLDNLFSARIVFTCRRDNFVHGNFSSRAFAGVARRLPRTDSARGIATSRQVKVGGIREFFCFLPTWGCKQTCQIPVRLQLPIFSSQTQFRSLFVRTDIRMHVAPVLLMVQCILQFQFSVSFTG
jgi:hypothetical protein